MRWEQYPKRAHELARTLFNDFAQVLNAMERQDLEDQLPRFQELWATWDPSGRGFIPPKHLFTVRPKLPHYRGRGATAVQRHLLFHCSGSVR